MAQSLPTARQGLGEPQQKGARVLAPRINPPHAQKTLQSGLNSPDRLLDRQACSGETFVQSFRGSAVGREPGIHNHRSGSMDSGLASASLRRPGMTSLTKLTPSVPRVL